MPVGTGLPMVFAMIFPAVLLRVLARSTALVLTSVLLLVGATAGTSPAQAREAVQRVSDEETGLALEALVRRALAFLGKSPVVAR